MIKKEARVIGIDDSPFDKNLKGDTLVIGTVFRGGSYLDGVVSTKVRVDGNNSTERVVAMINKSKWKPQLQCIFLDGIGFGGFNIIDINELHKKTGIPVIVVIRRIPDRENIIKTLKKIGMEDKVRLIEEAGEVKKAGRIYIQYVGIPFSKAKEFLKICCTHSLIPEPVRVSHIIASGVKLGESKGRV
ncbi:MAG TPA: DUF99 family protein [Candidatus Nanoarchaeia archaeon]|nr:DUF99 family protein [Candidatus Nanoarchaeia archaeon]